MKFIIKGKFAGALDTVTVTDENGEVLYTLKRDKDSAGHMIAMTDANGTKVADIEQRGSAAGKVSFAVLVNGEQTALVERKPTIRPGFTVSGPDWEVSGGVFSTKYKVTKGDKTVADLKAALLRSEVDIADGEDPFTVVAVVMAIRMMLYRASVIGATVAVVGTGAAVNSFKS